jgi:hypothetical protein
MMLPGLLIMMLLLVLLIMMLSLLVASGKEKFPLSLPWVLQGVFVSKGSPRGVE